MGIENELDVALMVIANLKSENARFREALELIATAQEQWSLEATLRSFVFELQKRTEIAQRALKGTK